MPDCPQFRVPSQLVNRNRVAFARTWLSLLLIVCLIVPGFQMPVARAADSDSAILLPETTGPIGPGAPANAAKTESNVLSLLKQVRPGISTIQIKELNGYRGGWVFVPVMDQTPVAFLDAVTATRRSDLRYVVIPLVNHPNAALTQFLEKNGFQVRGAHYLFRSEQLQLANRDHNAVLPLGTYVFELSGDKPAYATWGASLPASVASGNMLAVNWSWLTLHPEGTLRRLISLWPADAAVAARPEVEAPLPAPALASRPPVPAKPEMVVPTQAPASPRPINLAEAIKTATAPAAPAPTKTPAPVQVAAPAAPLSVAKADPLAPAPVATVEKPVPTPAAAPATTMDLTPQNLDAMRTSPPIIVRPKSVPANPRIGRLVRMPGDLRPALTNGPVRLSSQPASSNFSRNVRAAVSGSASRRPYAGRPVKRSIVKLPPTVVPVPVPDAPLLDIQTPTTTVPDTTTLAVQPGLPAARSAAPAPVAAPAAPEKEQDSNPAEMYDFDGKPGANGGNAAEAAARRRNEAQGAIAEFYNDRSRELSELRSQVELIMAQSTTTDARKASMRQAMENSDHAKSIFENNWFNRSFGPALASYEQAKSSLMMALFDKVPGTQIEGRAIWLDRGSIVSSGGPEGLRRIVRRIASAGFNIIYFETINAGYPIYPSNIIEQNPQVKGWDPLAVALDEAHQQGVELHAWVWVFAVGNTRHNRILGQSESFPGPILAKAELMPEALRGRSGELVLPEQYESWLSPASPKARAFLVSYFSEIIKKYKVDGLQLDYIRYPFQKPNTPMGFEPAEMSRFTAETGLAISPGADAVTQRVWQAWKAFQVTTFVRELSDQLRTINPDLKLSAAVFPLARHSRMLMIQQDWETWVRSGWIDTLSPMAYSRSARSLERLVQYTRNVGEDKTLVYPGLSLKKLNAIELLDTLEICRRTGVLGTTLFAMTQLDADKQQLLQTGPYKQRRTVPPHHDPLGASIQLVGETRAIVDGTLATQPTAPGDLNAIRETLQAMNTNLTALAQKSRPNETGYLLSAIRDDARALAQRTETWTSQTGNEGVASFQAKLIKQMVDKLVMMVNYASFQLANRQKRANGSTPVAIHR